MCAVVVSYIIALLDAPTRDYAFEEDDETTSRASSTAAGVTRKGERESKTCASGT